MCGIIVFVDSEGSVQLLEAELRDASKKIRHRGPDWSGKFMCKTKQGKICGFAHERLSIVDPEGQGQPLFSQDKSVILCVNGEIYNHMSLKYPEYWITGTGSDSYPYSTKSDCEVILGLYDRERWNDLRKIGKHIANSLDGQFSFCLYDRKKEELLVARDPIGITPLYWGKGAKEEYWFASEMKAIADYVTEIFIFPPGNIAVVAKGEIDFYKYYKPSWITKPLSFDCTDETRYRLIRENLEKAVRKRLMCDVPYGVLLSGGLDSSLVASIASRYCEKRVESGNLSPAHFPSLHTFSIGLRKGGKILSPDLKNARVVAKRLESIHHEFTFTIEEAIQAVPDVIYHLETYDVTTVRASVPMYLLARKIKSMGVKMVLSGEGADEIFGGYLYFHKAPNPEEFHKELVRKVQALHQYDCLRANKSTMAWGLEVRVPFLDKEVLDLVMEINPKYKMIDAEHMEKYLLRKSFDTKEWEKPYLPQSVLWRQKEQFSDGVGSEWIDALKEEAGKLVEDSWRENVKIQFPYNTPETKEALWYRYCFYEHFGVQGAETVQGGPSVACSSSIAAEWDENWKGKEDPSGRAVADIHNDMKDDKCS